MIPSDVRSAEQLRRRPNRPAAGMTWRLTRRGRAAVLAFLVLLTVLAGASLAGASRASDPPSPESAPTVVVRRYDTLWSIASRTAPQRDPRRVIAQIRQLNEMRDYTVHPGARLIVPRD